MPSPVLTIAMPFYNTAATMELSIRSLLHQTWGEFELLLCDDGSTDGSLAIARSFGDPRIVCWSDGRRRRLPTRLNECIDRAQGAYFARMDADDVAYPDRFATQLNFLEAHPEVDLCSAAAMVFGHRGRPLWCFSPPADHAAITRSPFRGFPLWHPLWMGRLAWFRRWRYQETASLAQDQEILLRSYRDSTFANLPEILLGYRQPQNSLGKLLRYKVLLLRYLSEQPGIELSLADKGKLVGITAARLAANCVSALGGPGRRLGHQATRAPSPAEVAAWNSLWILLSSWYWPPSSEIFNPSSLLPQGTGNNHRA